MKFTPVLDEIELTRVTVFPIVPLLGGLSPVRVTVKDPVSIPPLPAVTVTSWSEIEQVPLVEVHSEVAVSSNYVILIEIIDDYGIKTPTVAVIVRVAS